MKGSFSKNDKAFSDIKKCCQKNESSYENLGTLYTTVGFMFTFDDYDLERTNDKFLMLVALVKSNKEKKKK